MTTFRERVRNLAKIDRDAFEEIADRYERAWETTCGSAPEIANYLPPDEPLRALVFVELARIDLKARWQRNDQILSEVYLGQFSEAMQNDAPLKIELICWEYEVRPPDNRRRDKILSRFPDLADALGPALLRTASRMPWTAPPGYTDLEKLADGGMAEIWKTKANPPQKRIVVLKTVRLDCSDPEYLIARFRREIEAVSQLGAHPNIVPIYQVDEHSGRLFFSMPFLAGGNLHTITGAQEPRLSKEEQRKKALIVNKAARAVQYAHERGILHRDLKPANILLDELGEPYVADFGLAKFLRDESGLTSSGAFIGTPRYMAPEQALGSRNETVQTDVYGLGTVLYELLTGRPPFSGAHVMDTLRKVVDDEPDRPRSVRPQVARDLETICLKCLAKQPADRYGSAEALAIDLQCWLDDRPISARPANPGERLWRWCKRRPLVASLMLCLGLSIGAGVVGVFWQWRLAEGARSRAEYARDGTTAINRFLAKRILEATLPVGRGGIGRGVTLRDALDNAVPRIADDFSAQPELEGNVRFVLGTTYLELGAYESASTQLQKAFDIRRGRLGVDHLETQIAEAALALVWQAQGHWSTAEEVYRRVLESICAKLGQTNLDALRCRCNFAAILLDAGKWDEGETVCRNLQNSDPRVYDDDPRLRVIIQSTLGVILYKQGRLPAAQSVLQEALKNNKSVLGMHHPDVAILKGNLAAVMVARGEFDEAMVLSAAAFEELQRLLGKEHRETLIAQEALALATHYRGDSVRSEVALREILVTRRRVLGPHHPESLLALNNLATVLAALGRTAQAEQLLREAVDGSIAVLRSDHPDRLKLEINLGAVITSPARRKEKESLLKAAFDRCNRILGPDHPDTLFAQSHLAIARIYSGKAKETEETQRASLGRYRRVFGEEHPEALNAQMTVVNSLIALEKLAESEQLFRATVQVRCRRWPDHPDTFGLGSSFAGFLRAQYRNTPHLAKLGEAESLLRFLLERADKSQNVSDDQLQLAESTRAGILMDLGRSAEAEPSLRSCLKRREKQFPPAHWLTGNTRSLLGECLTKQRKYTEAEALLKTGYDALAGSKEAPEYLVAAASDRIIAYYNATGQMAKAGEWRAAHPKRDLPTR